MVLVGKVKLNVLSQSLIHYILSPYLLAMCRVREAMGRVKQIQDRAKRPRADQDAAKRMVA